MLWRRTLGNVPGPVEPTDDRLANYGSFPRVTALRHLLRQRRQFVTCQPAFGVQLIREANHLCLFFRRQPLNLCDDLPQRHSQS